MDNGNVKKKRPTRVSSIDLPPSRWMQLLWLLRRGDVMAHLGACLLSVVAIWLVMGPWTPPYPYRLGYVPSRNIVAQVEFEIVDDQATREARDRAGKQVPYVYQNDPQELVLLRAALQRMVDEIVAAPSFSELMAEREPLWRELMGEPTAGEEALTLEQQEERFEQFREGLSGDEGLSQFETAVAEAFAPLEQNGQLDKLPPEHSEGNQKDIFVYLIDSPTLKHVVQVSDVLIGDASPLKARLEAKLGSPLVAELVFRWVKPRLRPTLSFDKTLSQQERDAAVAAVPDQFVVHAVGETIAPQDRPLTAASMKLLDAEYAQAVENLGTWTKLGRSCAAFGAVVALFGCCGYFIYNRNRRLATEWRPLMTLLIMAPATLALARWFSLDPWRADIVLLLLFGLTFAVAFGRETSLLLTLSLAVLLSVATGQGMSHFLVIGGTLVVAVLQVGAIRDRTKLIRIGLVAAAVTFILSLGAGILTSQLALADGDLFDRSPLVTGAVRTALWTMVSGFIMTGMLPLVESHFGVLTEIRLLEFGDAAHPLLQELVRRAPGTYNHSINVASLAESAAESIGARGLLVRVGAYFHDIGKMLKPGYFVENQGAEPNLHEPLKPHMSTLIIIAHIKDGADLARQHRLPTTIIDFIEQHHGTTLVEYFYNRASEQQRRELHPDESGVQETLFRYPGPKPQTKEAAVLMIADAVESASRTLVDPAPARIESLVDGIAMSRLLDGQFDECGLTLQELRTIQTSLAKSLTAVYHSRIKYPDRRTAS